MPQSGLTGLAWHGRRWDARRVGGPLTVASVAAAVGAALVPGRPGTNDRAQVGIMATWAQRRRRTGGRDRFRPGGTRASSIYSRCGHALRTHSRVSANGSLSCLVSHQYASTESAFRNLSNNNNDNDKICRLVSINNGEGSGGMHSSALAEPGVCAISHRSFSLADPPPAPRRRGRPHPPRRPRRPFPLFFLLLLPLP